MLQQAGRQAGRQAGATARQLQLQLQRASGSALLLQRERILYSSEHSQNKTPKNHNRSSEKCTPPLDERGVSGRGTCACKLYITQRLYTSEKNLYL